MRLSWSPDLLQQMDVEMADYLLEVKEDILRSCREIVQAFSTE